MKYSFFVLSCLLSLGTTYCANYRVLTKEEYPIIERALDHSLMNHPNYESVDLLQQRSQTIDSLSNAEQKDHLEEDLKIELMQRAIKELSERNTHEVCKKHDERKKKWIAVSIGLVSTIITIVIPLFFSEERDCPSDG